MPVEKYSISLSPGVSQEIERRTGRSQSRSGVIDRDLTRYYAVLRHANASLATRFSDGEKGLILDACKGIDLDDSLAYKHLWAEIADAIPLGRLDGKWQIADPQALVTKIRALGFAETTALADAVARWWQRVEQGEALQPADLFAQAKTAAHRN